MSQASKKWHSVSIPESFSRRVKRILGFVADESLAEYARQAIQTRLRHDEAAYEEQKMEQEEIQARLRE